MDSKSEGEKRFILAKEAAVIFLCSPGTLRAHRQQGYIPRECYVERPGAAVKYIKEECDKFMAKAMGKPAQP